MLNRELTLVKTLLTVHDITEFAAEYLSQNLYHFDDKSEQNMAYALSNNLHRATFMVQATLSKHGFHCKERIYSQYSFKNVKYLDADLIGLVKKHIQQKAKQKTI